MEKAKVDKEVRKEVTVTQPTSSVKPAQSGSADKNGAIKFPSRKVIKAAQSHILDNLAVKSKIMGREIDQLVDENVESHKKLRNKGAKTSQLLSPQKLSQGNKERRRRSKSSDTSGAVIRPIPNPISERREPPKRSPHYSAISVDTHSTIVTKKGLQLTPRVRHNDKRVHTKTAVVIDAQRGTVDYPARPLSVASSLHNPESLQSIMMLADEFRETPPPSILLRNFRTKKRSNRKNSLMDKIQHAVFNEKAKQAQDTSELQRKVRFKVATTKNVPETKDFVKENLLKMGRLEVIPKPEKYVVDRFGNTKSPGINYTHKPNYGKIPSYIGTFKKQKRVEHGESNNKMLYSS